MSEMSTGAFPPETQFGTLEYWKCRCKKLEAEIAADKERLQEAAQRVGLEYGCDSPEWMADEILELRAMLVSSESPYYSKYLNLIQEADIYQDCLEMAIPFLPRVIKARLAEMGFKG